MKKLVLLLIFPFISFSQIVAENELYKVVYSEFYQQPISLNYKYPNPFEYKSTIILEKKVIPELKILIPKDSIALIEQKINIINSNGYYVDKNGKVSNRMIYDEEEKEINIEYAESTTIKVDTIITKSILKSFKAPLGIITSDDEDYNKPYDKGHLVPKESFPETKYNNFMYSFLNCALMHRTLNRGVWSTLEKKEREISNSAVLKVKILLSFGKNNIVAGGASIPDFFTKILEYKKFDENDEEIYIREVYTFPNDASVKGKDIEDYKVKLLTI
tara:strand:+ start:138 stop:959 length:822 start_codon:yes stop_codon:yes gene_type:complete